MNEWARKTVINDSHLRPALFILVVSLLLIALSACGPVAPSIDKSKGLSGGGGGTGGGTGQYVSVVVAASEFEAPSNSASLDAPLVSQFAQNQSVNFSLNLGLPTVAYFVVNLAPAQVTSLGAFQSLLNPAGGINWNLSVSASVPAEVRNTVLQNLAGVTFAF